MVINSQECHLQKFAENFGYSGLLGLFFLTIYSYISNFFIAHNFTHNSIYSFIFGLILLVQNCIKKIKNKKNNLC